MPDRPPSALSRSLCLTTAALTLLLASCDSGTNQGPQYVSPPDIPVSSPKATQPSPDCVEARKNLADIMARVNSNHDEEETLRRKADKLMSSKPESELTHAESAWLYKAGDRAEELTNQLKELQVRKDAVTRILVENGCSE